MKYEILLLLMAFTLISIPFIDSAKGETYEPKLIKSHEGITLISKIPVYEPEQMTIEILNVGNGTANFTNYFYTDLRLTEENTFSNLDSHISKSNITSITSIPRTLSPHESEFFIWTVNSEIFDEGTYTGKIFLNGTNFEMIPIDVSITYRVSPWDMLFYSFVGIGVAIVTGSTYEFYERRFKSKETVGKNYLGVYRTMFEVVKDILVHLDEQKKLLSKDYWVAYKEWMEKNIKEIENEIRNLSLSSESRGFLDFKELIKLFRENTAKYPKQVSENRDPLSYPMYEQIAKHMKENDVKHDVASINTHIAKFSKQKKIEFLDILRGTKGDPDVSNYDEQLEQATKSRNPRHRILYFIATSVISSISAFLVIDSFTGPYLANVAIAFALGFGIYRSKDFTKIFHKEE